MAFLGSTTIGGPIVGWFAQTFGDRWGLAIGGIAGLAAGLLGWINLRNFHSNSSNGDEK
jgi:predicted MFS family arabinose efflux permease